MKKIVAGLALACLALFSAPASAQTERWTAPSGGWSIDFAAAGWTYANPVPPDLQRFALIMIPLVPPPDNAVRFCTVYEAAENAAGMSDAEIRAGAARVTQEVASLMFPGEAITGVSITEINGVSVADITATRGAMVLRHRLFTVPGMGEQFQSVQVDCAWPATLDAAQAAEAGVILDTLAINAGSEDE
jgi:hypothetical protein